MYFSVAGQGKQKVHLLGLKSYISGTVYKFIIKRGKKNPEPDSYFDGLKG